MVECIFVRHHHDDPAPKPCGFLVLDQQKKPGAFQEHVFLTKKKCKAGLRLATSFNPAVSTFVEKSDSFFQ